MTKNQMTETSLMFIHLDILICFGFSALADQPWLTILVLRVLLKSCVLSTRIS